MWNSWWTTRWGSPSIGLQYILLQKVYWTYCLSNGSKSWNASRQFLNFKGYALENLSYLLRDSIKFKINKILEYPLNIRLSRCFSSTSIASSSSFPDISKRRWPGQANNMGTLLFLVCDQMVKFSSHIHTSHVIKYTACFEHCPLCTCSLYNLLVIQN